VEDSQLCFMPAHAMRAALLSRELSSVELVEAHLRQIERVNPKVNAFVTLQEETALAAAAAADRRLSRRAPAGPLDGLPIGIKDLFMTKGLRTTYGSPIYANHVPDMDHLIVEREKAAGAIILGKTNTPEFGAGAQTFNPVFGVTRNPYDLALTCGGSSGGSAVALACGMAALADGSDFGGSLRAPAAWCNVVGMRPSPGRVPAWPTRLAWSTLSVHGAMARTVEDLALFLRAVAGPDSRSPISIEQSSEQFAAPLSRDFRGVSVAWSDDLGYLPVDPVVTEVCANARGVLEDIGCSVRDAHPDFHGASEIFKTLRAEKYAIDRADELRQHRSQIKKTVIDNTEAGFNLKGLEPAQAEERRSRMWHQVREFMENYEFMVWPVNPVPPFSADQETITQIGDQAMSTYVDWGALRHVISVVGLPSISVPVGFTPDGLPTGLQITGRHHADFAVLQLAHAFESATQHWRQHPTCAI
jgi:amidase